MCDLWSHKVPFGFFSFSAGGMRPSRKRMPTKLCVMVEARSDQPGVPACLKCCPSCCSNSSCKVLVSSADVHGRRHLVDPISSTLCLRFGPHLRLKAPHHPLGLNLYSGNGCLCGNRIQTSTHFYKCVCVSQLAPRFWDMKTSAADCCWRCWRPSAKEPRIFPIFVVAVRVWDLTRTRGKPELTC